MFTIAICLSFVSIYCLYAMGKVEAEATGVMLLLKSKEVLARSLAGLTLLLSLWVFISQTGPAVGIFICLLFWMMLASCMVLFIPFKKIKWFHLTAGLLVLLAIEWSFLPS